MSFFARNVPSFYPLFLAKRPFTSVRAPIAINNNPATINMNISVSPVCGNCPPEAGCAPFESSGLGSPPPAFGCPVLPVPGERLLAQWTNYEQRHCRHRHGVVGYEGKACKHAALPIIWREIEKCHCCICPCRRAYFRRIVRKRGRTNQAWI